MGGIVGADRDARQPRQGGGAGQLGGAHHLVADQDVLDPAPGQRLGLGVAERLRLDERPAERDRDLRMPPRAMSAARWKLRCNA